MIGPKILDIGYAVFVTPDPGGYHADFTVYCLFGREKDGQPIYLKADCISSEPTDDVSQAEIYLSGGVKWDGCLNWTFDEQERCMLHFCGAKDAVQIGELFRQLYLIAAEVMPRHAANLGGA